MPRLLLITAAFPPLTGGPSDQMGKRAKYLSRLGWEVDVLTPEIPVGVAVDPEPPSFGDLVEVHRTPFLLQASRPSLRHDKDRAWGERGRSRGLADLLFVPGGYMRWLPSAVRAGRRIARRADAVLSVSNPITTHLVGRAVAASAGRPWIAELRDPIAGYRHSRRGPEGLNRWLEKRVVQAADGVVQWGDFVPEPVGERYPSLPAGKFRLIDHTGYDADDFAGYEHDPPVDGPLRACYTGSFYGDAITPVPFLRALGACLERDSSAATAVFAGDWSPEYDRLIGKLGLTGAVQSLGRVPRTECLRLWRRSHVLLLILGADGDDVDRIPSKFWDYVAAGARVLALVAPEGRLAGVVRSRGLGVVAAPDDVPAIGRALETLVEERRSGRAVPERDPDFLASVTKEASERALSAFLRDRAGLR